MKIEVQGNGIGGYGRALVVSIDLSDPNEVQDILVNGRGLRNLVECERDAVAQCGRLRYQLTGVMRERQSACERANLHQASLEEVCRERDSAKIAADAYRDQRDKAISERDAIKGKADAMEATAHDLLRERNDALVLGSYQQAITMQRTIAEQFAKIEGLTTERDEARAALADKFRVAVASSGPGPVAGMVYDLSDTERHESAICQRLQELGWLPPDEREALNQSVQELREKLSKARRVLDGI
jgi:hypothetical protein